MKVISHCPSRSQQNKSMVPLYSSSFSLSSMVTALRLTHISFLRLSTNKYTNVTACDSVYVHVV